MKKRRFFVLLILCMVLSACGNLSGQEERTDEQDEGVSQGETDEGNIEYSGMESAMHVPSLTQYGSYIEFSYQLFGNSLEEINPVLSPLSAYIAMSMVTDGAKEETLSELLKALGDGCSNLSAEMLSAFPVKQETGRLLLANSVWFDQNVSEGVKEEYTGQLEQNFDAQLYVRDLAAEDTQKEINEWVSQNTDEMIDEILEKPFDEDVRMALFNAVYFEGKWQTPFFEGETEKAPFTLEDGTTVETDMMNQKMERYRYYEGDEFESVILPYEDSSCSLIALLPREGQTVRELYASFDMDQIGKIRDYAESEDLDLQIPKFQVSADRDLIEALRLMGVTLAFSDEADFSGITDNAGLFISQVHQKAVFAVDEKGTKAAAVTEVGIAETSLMMDEDSIEFYLNRPFLYMIIDNDLCVPLFMGIMDNPTAE